MQFKEGRFYVWYGLLVSAFLIASAFFLNQLKEYSDRNFTGLAYLTVSYAVLILTGVVLGLERFLLERRKPGIWKVRLEKLLFVGLPVAYIAVYNFIYFAPIRRFLSMPDAINRSLIYESRIQFAGLVLLGYILITSFYKKSAAENQ